MSSSVLVISIGLIVTQCCQCYTVPKPEILVYKPRGFSVSIPDETGIRLFAFHGKINKVIQNLHPGDLTKEVKYPVNGKWIFHDERTKLKVGDTIHYWMFVVKDAHGYSLDSTSFTVTDLVENASTNSEMPTRIGNPNGMCSNEINTICLQSLFNVTQSFGQLQSYVVTLKKKSEQLRNFIEQSPSARKMTISGRIPLEGLASSTVAFLLREKLDINVVVVSAERHFDGSIAFEVPTIDDKLEILEAAKSKLAYTKIFVH
ncbi:hypothetical protein PPYR_07582 [Photinus pyralis]|uniref:CBM39 domain-containing protein n=2 Tax=Photinus pyralis TaxID=7054 RepID=A0A5N4AQS3_PHOPY|nr:uncharacterized protein LOC116169665 [Photinus pyralis]KAB0799702.1 hypothetical protein PPYR_07582 [Photinus pyralis]